MGEQPTRVQLRRTKGWRMPPNTVKVDRTTPWGNPYAAGLHCDQQHAVDCHRFLITQGRPAKTAPYPDRDAAAYAEMVRKQIATLRGKNLACWCPIISQGAYCPCHADVLLSIANDIPLDEVIRENTRRAEGQAVR